MAASKLIEVGTPAPDFELPDASGNPIRLSGYRGKKTVVLYFYPRDETPGCTKEACQFRDDYEDFKAAGAEVIGVSTDSSGAHQRFAGHHRLPFVLLSDERGRVGKQYGVKTTWGLVPGRVTFVIDSTGIVRLVFESQMRPKEHVSRALELVKTLGSATAPA
jgi:peroxiredoxin Q/BCP